MIEKTTSLRGGLGSTLNTTRKLLDPEEFDRKNHFFERWSWFKFTNLGLAIGMAFKFYTSVGKGLQLNIRKFWGLILMHVEGTAEKLVGGGASPILNKVKRNGWILFVCNWLQMLHLIYMLYSCTKKLCLLESESFPLKSFRITVSLLYVKQMPCTLYLQFTISFKITWQKFIFMIRFGL